MGASNTIALLGIGLIALPTGVISAGYITRIEQRKGKHETSICPHCGQEITP